MKAGKTQGSNNVVSKIVERMGSPTLPSKYDSCTTRLFASAEYSDPGEFKERFAESGGDPNVANSMNVTPPNLASQNGHAESVEIFLAFEKIQDNQRDLDFITALRREPRRPLLFMQKLPAMPGIEIDVKQCLYTGRNDVI